MISQSVNGSTGSAAAPANERATSVVAVADAGWRALGCTTAVNLAVAFAAAGLHTLVRDLDPAGLAARALGWAPRGPAAGAQELRLYRRLRGRLAVETRASEDGASRLDGTEGAEAAAPNVVVVACSLGSARDTDPATETLRTADVVLLPVDASPPALEALAAIATALGEPADRPGGGADGESDGRSPAGAVPRLRIVMARVLPRQLDRWAVVERLAEQHPGALYVNTVPMGRRAPPDGAGAAATATLYAPTTRAAAAYAALAREVAADLGVRV